MLCRHHPQHVHSAASSKALQVTVALYVGHEVGQIVEALRFKPDGREVESLWYDIIVRPHYRPGLDSDSNKN